MTYQEEKEKYVAGALEEEFSYNPLDPADVSIFDSEEEARAAYAADYDQKMEEREEAL